MRKLFASFALAVAVTSTAATGLAAPSIARPTVPAESATAVGPHSTAPVARAKPTAPPASITVSTRPAEQGVPTRAPQPTHLPAVVHAAPRSTPATRPDPASAPSTESVAIEAKLNVPLAEQFPRLAPVLKDPDAFFATMSGRFARQKVLTPTDPYRFDYSEIGIPLVRDMRASLKVKLDELTAGKVARSPENRKIAIQHLTELAEEADRYLNGGAVSYRGLIELCHFYTRAIGQFDTETYPAFKRQFLRIDERIEGYKAHSPAQEYADYRARRFSVFQDDTKTASKGFAAAQESFEQAVFDPTELKTLLVPTNDELTEHLLLRLASREKINMVGVLDKPLLADGFLRPPGMFWVHDLRHQSAKFDEKHRYVQRHGISTQKERALNELMDRFYLELRGEMESVADPQLREALRLLTFNFYFDRGNPMMPSTFIEHSSTNVALALYIAEKLGGQGVTFKAPLRNLGRAAEWLRTFWEKRTGIEADFLAGDAERHAAS